MHRRSRGPSHQGGAVRTHTVVCYLWPPPTSSRPPGTSRGTGYRQASLPATRRGGAEEDLPISEDNHLTVPSPLRRRVPRCPLPDPRHLPWPSPTRPAARLPLGPPYGGESMTTLVRPRSRGDLERLVPAARTRYGPVSCSTPLRTRPLDHARGCPYRGPGRLPGPDLPWLAISSSLG